MRSKSEEIERYTRAAEQALDRLDWCIDYLYRIRKDPEEPHADSAADD